MSKLFKNFFFSKRFSKTTIISIVLSSIILGLVLPALASADDGWRGFLKDFWGGLSLWWKAPGEALSVAAKGLLWAIQTAIFTILCTISGTFLFATQSLLNWVMSPNFINVSFTQNEFVTTGWRITRDLTNILIVLGLVAIALATILRISTYHAKKTLPLLLIVALLVNFSPVICGLIIDASNIVMNYFLKAGGLSTSFVKTLGDELSALVTLEISESERLGRGIVFIGFNIIGGIIFLLYAFLFLFRYIALWMLVILSPLAFLCYVFPYTKKWWDMWWKQFIQWCIIGIPAAFSIFLANEIIIQMTQGNLISEAPAELSQWAMIVGYIVPLAFLIVGFLMSLQTGAAGAGIVTGAFEKFVVGGGKKAGRWIGRKGWQMTKEATREPRRRAGEALRKIKTGKEGKEEKEKGHPAKQAGRRLTGWALRPFGRLLERGAAEEASGEIKEAEEKAKGKTEEAIAMTMEVGGVNQGIGTLREAIRSKKLRKIRDRGLVNDEKLKRLARATVMERPELFEDIRDVLPKMAGEIGEEMEGKIEGFKKMGKYKAAGRLGAAMKRAGIDLTTEDRGKYGTLTEKIRATAKPAKIDLWNKGEMQEAIASPIFKRYMTPGQLSQMAKTFERDFFDAWDKVAPSKEWLEKWNKPVEKYIERSPSGAFGIPFGTKEPSVSVMGKVSRKWSKEEKEREERRGGYIGGKGPTD